MPAVAYDRRAASRAYMRRWRKRRARMLRLNPSILKPQKFVGPHTHECCRRGCGKRWTCTNQCDGKEGFDSSICAGCYQEAAWA